MTLHSPYGCGVLTCRSYALSPRLWLLYQMMLTILRVQICTNIDHEGQSGNWFCMSRIVCWQHYVLGLFFIYSGTSLWLMTAKGLEKFVCDIKVSIHYIKILFHIVYIVYILAFVVLLQNKHTSLCWKWWKFNKCPASNKRPPWISAHSQGPKI